MIQDWLHELLSAAGKLFIHPLTYWAILLILISGYVRIKRERKDFGVKVSPLFTEWRHTWKISIGAGFLLSMINLGAGMVFQFETILLLGWITLLLSLPYRFTLLSPAYTLGITYLLLLLLPIGDRLFFGGTMIDGLQQVNLLGIVLLLGILLIIEALLVRRAGQEGFPRLIPGRRGGWIGQHHLKKMSIIPFFTLVPMGAITPFADFWPYFSIGGESYGLVLIPFLLGFDYGVKSRLPQQAAGSLFKATLLLSLLVLLLAVGGIYQSLLIFVAAAAAIIGREYISYRHRIRERKGQPYFRKMGNGLRVLGIIQGTPADRMDIGVGETITKVNGRKVDTEEGFYQALQGSGAYFKLEVLNAFGEMRFVQGAFYEGDHYELGLVFVTGPHRER
ncbi:PDZ domain-containing protein [Virgibacillus sediminis]|uniref:PDZ domain-containing protein n=1 Tax=Virgibacillus sediminis TaxID=202260 RepID=A0ABV7A2S1_9BACI